MRRRKHKSDIFCFLIGFCLIIYISGIIDHVFEESYELNFNYPLNINVTEQIHLLSNGKNVTVTPINRLPYIYLIYNEEKCNKELYLLILVKSAIKNIANRNAIRETWGKDHRDPVIRVLFFLGTTDNAETLNGVNEESKKYRDIVQMNFKDNYYNNTIKTLMTFRWAYFKCRSKFYFFSDDDNYVSIINLLKFTLDPENYPDVVTTDWNRDLFGGFVVNSSPFRHLTSKWRVSLQEYPWDRWPLYLWAGAYILNEQTLKKMYLGTLWVKTFRFDDIYLGIVAAKLNITPLHCSEIYFYKKMYYPNGYQDVIVSHGYDNPKELVRVWNKQFKLEFA